MRLTNAVVSLLPADAADSLQKAICDSEALLRLRQHGAKQQSADQALLARAIAFWICTTYPERGEFVIGEGGLTEARLSEELLLEQAA
jgi:hypothetical protein